MRSTKSLEKDVENLVKLGVKLDAGKRKDRVTYSEENRRRLIQNESKVLQRLAALLAMAGGMAAVYALFTRRKDLSKKMTEITVALGPKLNPLIERIRGLFKRHESVVAKFPNLQPKREAKIPMFIKYISTHAKNSYVRGAKDFKRLLFGNTTKHASSWQTRVNTSANPLHTTRVSTYANDIP